VATFLLIHGSYHGGWCWRRLRPLLRAAGHEVFSPTLTGLGDRAHLLNRMTGLQTHLKDIVRLVQFEDLTQLILVGHSYGAVLATAVLHQIPERLAHVVYCDAGVPRDGQSAWDLFDEPSRAAILERVAAGGSDWLAPPPPCATFGITDPVDCAWVEPRLTPMPLRAWQEPVRLRNPRAAEVGGTVIACSRGSSRPDHVSRLRRLATEQDWGYAELESGHDAMITHPDQVAAILLAIAGRQS